MLVTSKSACILSVDLHIFVCTYSRSVKNFSHLNMVLSGYPDQRRPFLFSSFRRVLNVMCSFLGNSPASEF